MKGALILQISKDGKNWNDVQCITSAFDAVPIRTEALYRVPEVQLLNGCYYRLIAACKLERQTDPQKLWFISGDQYEYRKTAEVYEFYVCTDETEELSAPKETYRLGDKIHTENHAGYAGNEVIEKENAHYGWDLGDFFISGYTDTVRDEKGDPVFLKNAGDKATLWFHLNQNIHALNGNGNLEIAYDPEGYDQYFETPKMEFGRGALIVRYTDYQNIAEEPVIYTNYLEAGAVTGADTKVQLFEEGDYEAALD